MPALTHSGGHRFIWPSIQSPAPENKVAPGAQLCVSHFHTGCRGHPPRRCRCRPPRRRWLLFQLSLLEPLFGPLSKVFLIQMLGRLAPSVGDLSPLSCAISRQLSSLPVARFASPFKSSFGSRA